MIPYFPPNTYAWAQFYNACINISKLLEEDNKENNELFSQNHSIFHDIFTLKDFECLKDNEISQLRELLDFTHPTQEADGANDKKELTPQLSAKLESFTQFKKWFISLSDKKAEIFYNNIENLSKKSKQPQQTICKNLNRYDSYFNILKLWFRKLDDNAHYSQLMCLNICKSSPAIEMYEAIRTYFLFIQRNKNLKEDYLGYIQTLFSTHLKHENVITIDRNPPIFESFDDALNWFRTKCLEFDYYLTINVNMILPPLDNYQKQHQMIYAKKGTPVAKYEIFKEVTPPLALKLLLNFLAVTLAIVGFILIGLVVAAAFAGAGPLAIITTAAGTMASLAFISIASVGAVAILPLAFLTTSYRYSFWSCEPGGTRYYNPADIDKASDIIPS